MKKNYVAPIAEVVKFEYRDQVVAASRCGVRHTGTTQTDESVCTCGDWSPWRMD